MTSRAALTIAFLSVASIGCQTREAPLRVCADPNNLPFTNSRLEGFENELAALLAADLGTGVEYVWWAQRRGFLRSTLNAGRCDVVMGLPTAVEAAMTTRRYYRSSYVFVTPRDGGPHGLQSFDDPRLRKLRIGVPVVGDDGAAPPPAHALARRGLVRNIVGYSVYGDYREDTPPSALIRAVADGEIDVAAAWGPLAGYYAARQAVPLVLHPIVEPGEGPQASVAFDISMATRRGDDERHRMLESFIERRRSEIDRILVEYHVPRLDSPTSRAASR